MSNQAYPDEKASLVRPDMLAEDTHTGVMLREDQVVRSLLNVTAAREATIHYWLPRYSIMTLRISMGAVLFGFGILKYFPGLSPAEDIVLATTHLLSFGLVPAVVSNGVVMVLIATLECSIGLLLITGLWLRAAIALLMVHLTGILSPVVLLTGRLFAGPYHMPTLEGQYVLKNVVLLAATMVIATTVRSPHRWRVHFQCAVSDGDRTEKKVGQQ